MPNHIKQLRQEKHMTQLRLSIELGVTQETVSAYERGKHYPSVQALAKMSKLFGASIDYILGFSDIRYPVCAATLPDAESILLSQYRRLNNTQKEKAAAFMQGMLETV